MITVTLTITGDYNEMADVNLRDLFELPPAKRPQLTLFAAADKLPKPITKKHTILGFKKVGPNWQVVIEEDPYKWTFPCESNGAGNTTEFKKMLAHFADLVDKENSTDEQIKFKDPTKAKVVMQVQERGKFAAEWVWLTVDVNES